MPWETPLRCRWRSFSPRCFLLPFQTVNLCQMPLDDELQSFASNHNFLKSKGALSLALILTRLAKDETFPLQEADFVTAQKGQVKVLSGEAIQKILSEHGIHRILAREGGRTSRGSMGNMQDYLSLLNQLQEREPKFDLEIMRSGGLSK